MPATHEAVVAKIADLYRMLFEHSGYGEMTVEIRYLRKKEKEVLIRCGKQYRFVVPFDCGHGDDCGCGGDCGDNCICKQGGVEGDGKTARKPESVRSRKQDDGAGASGRKTRAMDL